MQRFDDQKGQRQRMKTNHEFQSGKRSCRCPQPPTRSTEKLSVQIIWLHKESTQVHFQFVIPYLMCLWRR
ncbi:hypothetical protein JOB18_017338 [Solea senegalensis]|uniref:Uncharacterized protein n=1 Tax=Solea senegalensis TaxID=28829 RepID=A0AAV6RY33_SOLSE|nr:hypothetical protein JOB18_017338 [Solea senegalensis]